MGEKQEIQVVITNESLLKEITFNYDQLKTKLNRQLKKYKGEVTAESIKDAKEDRAELNSLERILASKGSEIQARILGDFVEKMKELRGMIKDASSAIDSQVKALEQKTKDKKTKEIRQLYDEKIGELKNILPFEKLFNDRWLNVGMTPEKTDGSFNYGKVEVEIESKIDTVKKDLSVIDSLGSEFEFQIKDHYLQNYDLAGALSEKTRLEAQRAKIQSIKPMEKVAEAFISKPESELDSVDWANVSKKDQERSLTIICSANQFNLVKTFLNAHKIKWEEK